MDVHRKKIKIIQILFFEKLIFIRRFNDKQECQGKLHFLKSSLRYSDRSLVVSRQLDKHITDLNNLIFANHFAHAYTIVGYFLFNFKMFFTVRK